MIYLKSFLAGLAALILVALLAIGILFARMEMSSDEGIGVVSGPGWPVLAVSLLAFAVGFFWQYRRTRR
jgi:hypothetical protein